MHIALIGCNSLLASYLIERLVLRNSFRLSLLGRREPAGLSKEPNVTFVPFDSPNEPLDMSQLLAYDAIVFCVAAGVQANSTLLADEVHAVNYSLPVTILSFLEEHNYTGKWFSFGTYFEIGSTDEHHFATEEEVVNSPCAVPNSYCESKRMLSKYIYNNQFSFSAFHLILPTIYGVKEDRNRLIPYLFSSLHRDETPKLSSGIQVRQYIHGRDVAELIELLLAEPLLSGLYNVGSKEVVQIKEVVELVFKQFGQDANKSLGQIHTRDESMKTLLLDGSKLLEALPSWRTRISLEAGMEEYLSVYTDNTQSAVPAS